MTATQTAIKRRKRRKDINHVVYQLSLANTGDTYIGVTVKDSTPAKSVQRRFSKHVHRAFGENRDWPLCNAIRTHGHSAFDVKVIAVIRGKTAAHAYERELIGKIKPTLNIV